MWRYFWLKRSPDLTSSLNAIVAPLPIEEEELRWYLEKFALSGRADSRFNAGLEASPCAAFSGKPEASARLVGSGSCGRRSSG